MESVASSVVGTTSVVEQATGFVSDLDSLIQAYEDGLLSHDEYEEAKVRLILASPDPEFSLLSDTTRYIPLD